MKIELFTDGACRGNGKPDAIAGWAWSLIINDEEVHYNSGRIGSGTNNQGELQAIIDGLEFILENVRDKSREIIVVSDSAYCINGICEWRHNWKRNNWHKNVAQTSPVKNKEYWLKLDKLVDSLNLTWQWVKGHDNGKSPWNERVDKLAQAQTRL